MDNHWRIRERVVQQAPLLAKQFGVQMFEQKLEAAFLSSLRDSVQCVRQAAIENLKEIATIFGERWTIDHLLPKIVDQYSASSGYANRLTVLLVLPQVASVMTPDRIHTHILSLLNQALSDSVP